MQIQIAKTNARTLRKIVIEADCDKTVDVDRIITVDKKCAINKVELNIHENPEASSQNRV